MRSLIILEVEHDENTDDIQEFVELAKDCGDSGEEFFTFDFRVVDYTVRVDLPACFELED